MPTSTCVHDSDTTAQGSHPCQRCVQTGRFITGVLNGRPTGPGGACFRCGGKGHHTQKDRRRNAYYDAHQRVRL